VPTAGAIADHLTKLGPNARALWSRPAARSRQAAVKLLPDSTRQPLTGQPSKNIGPTACGEAYEDPHRSRRIGLRSCATRGGWERGGTATRCRNRRRGRSAAFTLRGWPCSITAQRRERPLFDSFGRVSAVLLQFFAHGPSFTPLVALGESTQEIVPARISEQSIQAAPGPLHRTDGGFVLPTPRTDFFVCPEEPDFAFHFFGFTANIVHAFGNHATDAVVAIRPQASGSKERSDLAVRDRPFHVPPRSQYFTLSRARGRTRCTKYPAGCGSLFSFSASVDRNGSPANAAGLPCRH
jgi:hypothetical protein